MAGKLRLDWSPEQIAGWLKRTHPEDASVTRCHTRRSTVACLSRRGRVKKELLVIFDRGARCVAPGRLIRLVMDAGHIKDIVSIRQRPAAAKIGRCLAIGKAICCPGRTTGYIATLAERHTRYVMLASVAGKDTQTVVSALIKQAKKPLVELYEVPDPGTGARNSTDHRRFTLATRTSTSISVIRKACRQRGSNENTNGLLETVLSKGHRFIAALASPSDQAARRLNERPRETLQFETPAERFNACVVSTG